MKTYNQSLITILFLLLSFQAQSIQIGAGVGIPYGGLGANLRHSLNDSLNGSLGLGMYPQGVGLNFGMQYYPNQSGLKLGGYYGSSFGYTYNDNCRLRSFGITECDELKTIAEGLTLGIGWDAGKHKSGWEIEGFYRVTLNEKYEERTGNEIPRFSIGFGYHWAPF